MRAKNLLCAGGEITIAEELDSHYEDKNNLKNENPKLKKPIPCKLALIYFAFDEALSTEHA